MMVISDRVVRNRNTKNSSHSPSGLAHTPQGTAGLGPPSYIACTWAMSCGANQVGMCWVYSAKWFSGVA